jgi:uncharacterized membrane protein YgdD (TMEM256/DUF423 family)
MDFRTWVLVGAVFGFTGVALGAFGAHGLSARLEAAGRSSTFETAVQYHLIHAVALVALGALSAATAQQLPGAFNMAAFLMAAGTIVFSGALYLLAIFDVRLMGAIAPIGGVLMLAGWGALIWAILRAASAPAGFGGAS